MNRASNLPSINHSTRRGSVERSLQLWVARGVLWSASVDEHRPGCYTIVGGQGDLWEHVTLKEARLLCHGAANAWRRQDERRLAAQSCQS